MPRLDDLLARDLGLERIEGALIGEARLAPGPAIRELGLGERGELVLLAACSPPALERAALNAAPRERPYLRRLIVGAAEGAKEVDEPVLDDVGDLARWRSPS